MVNCASGTVKGNLENSDNFLISALSSNNSLCLFLFDFLSVFQAAGQKEKRRFKDKDKCENRCLVHPANRYSCGKSRRNCSAYYLEQLKFSNKSLQILTFIRSIMYSWIWVKFIEVYNILYIVYLVISHPIVFNFKNKIEGCSLRQIFF